MSDDLPQETKDAIDRSVSREFAEFWDMCPPDQDPVLSILRVHLLTEHYLEQIFLLSLPRGDKLLGDGELSYAQKLKLAEALGVLPDRIVQVLRNLNRLRNRCAHEKNRKISASDVESVGRSLGREFTQLKRDHVDDLQQFLNEVLSSLCRHMTWHVFALEEQHLISNDDDPSQNSDDASGCDS